jgi:outer membrane protein TolC
VAWGKVQDKTAYERALLAKEQAEIQLKQVRTEVHEDVREILRTLRETEKVIIIQGKKVEQAKRLVEAERVRFERGLKDSFDVIRAEDNLLSAKNAFINRKVGYVVLLAQLEVVVGKPTGRVDLKAKTPGGQIEGRPPETLTPDRRPKPAPAPDTKLEDKY